VAGDEWVSTEVTVATPVQTVWRALRDREEIRRWHGWEYDGIEAEIDEIYIDAKQADDQAHTLDTGAGVFELEPRADSTVVRVTRARPEGERWAGVLDEIDQGWITFVQQLRLALERHAGEVWFQSDDQLGLTVDDWGDGLLVVVAERTGPEPNGSGAAVITTYGLDEREHQKLEQRWQAFWKDHYRER